MVLYNMPHVRCYPERAPKVDRVLEGLSHHLRREVVYYFEHTCSGNAASFDEVVAHVEEGVPHASGERLAIALTHCHLPRLQQLGWLEFDRRSEEIRYHGHDSAHQLLTEVIELFAEE